MHCPPVMETLLGEGMPRTKQLYPDVTSSLPSLGNVIKIPMAFTAAAVTARLRPVSPRHLQPHCSPQTPAPINAT